MSDKKIISVYAHWEGMKEPFQMGNLVATQIKGREDFSFEYTKEWLQSGFTHTIDPDLQLYSGRYFPRDEKSAGEMRQINDKANAIIKTFADGDKVIYQDIGAKFLGADGVMSKDMMGDFLHPGNKGYENWAAEIEENIARLLGEKK